MAKGYQKVVEAKLLHVVDEAFYLIPTDDVHQLLLLGSFDLRGINNVM